MERSKVGKRSEVMGRESAVVGKARRQGTDKKHMKNQRNEKEQGRGN